MQARSKFKTIAAGAALLAGIFVGVSRFSGVRAAPPANQVAEASADPSMTLVSVMRNIRNTPDPDWKGTGGPMGKVSDLHWLCDVKFCGNYVITVGRNDWFCVFERDPATAKLAFKNSNSGPFHNWDWYMLATKELPDHQWIVYCSHSRSLDWYKLDTTTGALAWQGNVDTPRNSFATMMSDNSHLVITTAQHIEWASLNAQTGKPTILTQWPQSELPADARFSYSVSGNDIIGFSINKDGSKTQICKITIDGLSTSRFGGFVVSPDGRHAYRAEATEIAIMDRDPQTGVLKYKTTQKLDDINCIIPMIFAPDGRTGYFGCMGEGSVGATSSNCIGSFTCDPDNGALTYQGKGAIKGGFTGSVI